MNKNIKKTEVVIVGGGFGGIYTAKNLLKFFKRDEVDITLINKSNYFLFTPLLHEVATGGLTPDTIIESLREVFRNTPIKFVEDLVTEVDQSTKVIKTSTQSFNYDYLVISSGAETNYFGTPGAKENSFPLKNLPDAVALRNHIIATCEKAVLTHDKSLLKCAIVGAGATGVELAAELQEYMEHTICTYYRNSEFTKQDIRVNLITATPEIIAQFPAKMRTIAHDELIKKGINIIPNTIVTQVEEGKITLKDGTSILAHTIVWVAGVTPILSNIKGIVAGPKGRMEVNEFLQTLNDTSVFALGDAGGSFPMLAQIAVQQGRSVAYNIHALVSNKPLEKFSTNIKGLLLSIGQWYAIGNFGKITLRGPLMWWLWRTIYLFNFHSWKKRFEIAVEWTINLFYPRDITYIK